MKTTIISRLITVLSVLCLLSLVACGGGGSSNKAPTISVIDDRSIAPNTQTVVNVTITDDRTDANSLVLTASSDNTTLIADSSITFGGSGSNRTITLSPESNQLGDAVITVTVSDERGKTAESVFLLTVEQPVVSFSQLVRDVFTDAAESQPREINGSIINQDAENDDFSDLL